MSEAIYHLIQQLKDWEKRLADMDPCGEDNGVMTTIRLEQRSILAPAARELEKLAVVNAALKSSLDSFKAAIEEPAPDIQEHVLRKLGIPCDVLNQMKELEEEFEGCSKTIERQCNLLTRTVDILKGEPPESTHWSHHDVPEIAAALQQELQEAKALKKELEEEVEGCSKFAATLQQQLQEAKEKIAKQEEEFSLISNLLIEKTDRVATLKVEVDQLTARANMADEQAKITLAAFFDYSHEASMMRDALKDISQTAPAWENDDQDGVEHFCATCEGMIEKAQKVLTSPIPTCKWKPIPDYDGYGCYTTGCTELGVGWDDDMKFCFQCGALIEILKFDEVNN